MKETLSLAHHYRITILGGVIDGSYQGRIKVILLNMGDQTMTTPHYAPFCKTILMSLTRCSFVRGVGPTITAQGCGTGVNRGLPYPSDLQANNQRHSFTLVGSRRWIPFSQDEEQTGSLS